MESPDRPAAGGGRYLFRGDDDYHGGPLGKSLVIEADEADIESPAEHVLRKESGRTSRFTSFSTETKIARKFTTVADHRRLCKVAIVKLLELEQAGQVRIWDPDRVYEALRGGSRRDAKQAGDVRAAMRRNSEILVEGQIPADLIEPVDD